VSIDDIEKRFVRTSRLFRRKGIALKESGIELVLRKNTDLGSAHICGTSTDPVILISLEKLEDALHGFQDTGTWGDYFESPKCMDSDSIELRSPSGGGRADYKLDLGDDDGDSD
jgi:hypothetical protein